jgi:predicted secreted protein
VKKRAAMIIGLLAATTGCMASEPELMGARGERLDRESAAANPQVSEAQNGTIVTLPVGGTLTVRLSGNRTTGYYWAVAERPAIVTLTGENYVQDPSEPGMVGVGGTEEFVFRAATRGRGTLRLEQRGAGNRGVAERWAVTVVVR